MPSLANYVAGQDQDNLLFQKLEESLKGFQSRKGCYEVTFVTDQVPNGMAIATGRGLMFERLPILMWMDRELLTKVEALPKPSSMSNEQYMDLRLVEQALQQARKSGTISKLETGPQCELAAALYTLEKILGAD